MIMGKKEDVLCDASDGGIVADQYMVFEPRIKCVSMNRFRRCRKTVSMTIDLIKLEIVGLIRR
jgi:hypothetical protein